MYKHLTFKSKFIVLFLTVMIFEGLITLIVTPTVSAAGELEETETAIDPDILNIVPTSIMKQDSTVVPLVNNIAYVSGISGKGGYIKVAQSGANYIGDYEVRKVAIVNELNGSKSVWYKATIPIERDYNIYTMFSAEDLYPNSRTITLSSATENQINVARIYVGDKTDDQDMIWDGGYQNAWGWKYGQYDCVGSLLHDPAAPQPWMFRSDIVYVTSPISGTYPIQSFPLINTILFGTINRDYHGNDGNGRFCSLQPTVSYYANIPYMKLTGMIRGNTADLTDTVTITGEDNIENQVYNQQQTEILNEANIISDLGPFQLRFDCEIDTMQGALQTLILKADGSLQLNLDNMFVRMSDAYVLSAENRKGFIETSAEDVTEGYVDSVLPTSSFADSSYAPPNQVSSTDGSKRVTISSPTPVVTSTIKETAQSTSYCDYPTSTITMYSKDLATYYANGGDQKAIQDGFDLKNWELRLNGFHLSPQVRVLEKTTTINHKTWWVNINPTSVDVDPISATGTIKGLAGWNMYNTFIHQRVRVNLEVFSKYNIITDQPDDQIDNSLLENPEDVINHRKISVSDFGVKAYSASYGSSLEWWQDLFDNPLILILVIAVVGVGVAVIAVVIGGKAKIAKSAIGKYTAFLPAPPQQSTPTFFNPKTSNAPTLSNMTASDTKPKFDCGQLENMGIEKAKFPKECQ